MSQADAPSVGALASLRDVALVARFELLRAVRTWRALALIVLYLVASVGAALMFSQFILFLEQQAADALGAAIPTRPGALTSEVVESPRFQRTMVRMTGDAGLVDDVLKYPPLAIFHLWFGLGLSPFFAATSAAESISQDLRTKTLRYEALRTGRLELVFGRFGGQVLLVGLATFVTILGVWCVGVFYMLGHHPATLALDLLTLSLRSWAYAVAFVGIGIGCSQLTASTAWARVLAVAATAGTWALAVTARHYREESWGLVCDVVLKLLPQGWTRGLWRVDGGWLVPALVCVAFGIAVTGLGWLRFNRRDL